MNNTTQGGGFYGSIGIALSLTIPSIGLIQHSVGNTFVLVYLILSIPLLMLIYYKYPNFFKTLSHKQATWLGIVILAILFALTAFAYPLANKGILPGGNERDELINGAINELLNGRYPYYFNKGPRSPVSPFPGWLLLNVPFVFLFKSCVYQNFFWLFLFYIIVGKFFLDRRSTLILILIMLVFSPVILHELISGSDLLSNVLLITLLAIGVQRYNTYGKWVKFSLAVLAGFAFSSRPNLVFVLPLFLSTLYQRAGLKDCIKFFTVLGIVAVAVTLPFYLYDPAGFSPLHTTMYVSKLNAVLPRADVIIVGITGLMSILLAFQNYRTDDNWRLMRNCGVVLSIPIFFGIVLMSLVSHSFEVGPYSNHGLSFMFFGALASWKYRNLLMPGDSTVDISTSSD